MAKLLSVIISNRNDTAMLSVTVNSCIEELTPLGLERCEIIICDNSDEQVFKLLSSVLPTGYVRERLLKVFRQPFPCLFSARQLAVEKAQGTYIACMDSHMLAGHNMFLDLLNFMKEKEDDKTVAFAHAPINWSNHHIRYAKHDRDLSISELGPWGSAYNYPRTITWKGIPWICKRSYFLESGGYGTLAKEQISWGGGDMYLGTKAWLLGFKNWAVPTRPAIHIGPFPKIDTKGNDIHTAHAGGEGYKYRVYSSSGKYPHTFGFLVSCYILGGEAMMKRNEKALTERFGKFMSTKEWWFKAIELGQTERKWLLANQKMSFDEFLLTQPWNEDDSSLLQKSQN